MDWSFKTFYYMNDFDHQMSKKVDEQGYPKWTSSCSFKMEINKGVKGLTVSYSSRQPPWTRKRRARPF